MTQFPAGRQSPQARAQEAALAVARLATWPTDQVGLKLDRRYAHYFYVDKVDLLLVPATGSLLTTLPIVDRAMLDARSDALVVSIHAKSRAVSLALGLWNRHENDWHAPMRLWTRSEVGVWLVPDPYHAGVRRACFRMLADRRLIAGPKPWRSAAEHRHGCEHADAVISRVLGG